MPTDTFLYFAYGSNMLTARLRRRCRSASAVGTATLSNYDLRWHKCSTDGSGKCDIVATSDPKNLAFGVLYEITKSEKSDLDEVEGLGKGYEEIDARVVCDGNETPAKVYRATRTDPTLKPYSWYHALVMAGAKEHGLPSYYVAQIEQVACVEDPNRARHEENMSLLEGACA